MMQLRTFDVFTKKADQYYTDLLSSIDYYIDGITQNKMSDEAIQAKQLEIFNAVYIIPQIKIGKEQKDFKTEQLPFREASQLIGNGYTYYSSESSSTITELNYTLPYTGNSNALSVTEKFPKRSFRGVLNSHSIILQHHFQGTDVLANGPAFKSTKEQFLELIESNNNDVKTFLENKREAFLNQITFKIQNKLAANQKRIDDLDSF